MNNRNKRSFKILESMQFNQRIEDLNKEKTVKGTLKYDHTYDAYLLEGETFTNLNSALNDYNELEIEITIKLIEKKKDIPNGRVQM